MAEWLPVWKKLFIRFTTLACRNLLPIYVSSYFLFDFEGRIWDAFVLVPDNCLSFYFTFSYRPSQEREFDEQEVVLYELTENDIYILIGFENYVYETGQP